jgi:hypothetical protein
MATKIGTIWAQAVWWNSTSSTKTRHVVFAASRNITAYSSLSSYVLSRPSHSHAAFGGSDPPWLCIGETGIAWYRALGQRHPNAGEFQPPLPYIQADNVTEITFRLSAGIIGDGSCSVHVVHVINYFE